MITRSKFGHPLSTASFILTLAQLQALDVTENIHGELFYVGGTLYYYHSTSVVTADSLFVVAPTTGPGRYLVAPGSSFDLAVAIGFGTADAAALATVPVGGLFAMGRSYWSVTTGFTGGTSSAIGLSSNQTGYSTKGDLLGGASGDVAATLVLGTVVPGTVGAKNGAALLKAGTIIRYDQVTSTFTAGAGFARLVGQVIENAGA